MIPILIREIQEHDNQAIADVIRKVFISDDYPKTGTAFEDPQLDMMFETYQTSKSTYFVIERDGKIVGGAGISQLQNSDESICELQKMYFLKEARGSGLGLLMIQKCLEKAKEFGYQKCYLETLPTMKIAQKLYQKVGFNYLDFPLGATGHTSCPIWMIKVL
jgi:putative acetyltransferase